MECFPLSPKWAMEMRNMAVGNWEVGSSWWGIWNTGIHAYGYIS